MAKYIHKIKHFGENCQEENFVYTKKTFCLVRASRVFRRLDTNELQKGLFSY